MSVIAEVKAAYNDRTRNLHFKASKPVLASHLLPIVRSIGRYNKFSPASVSQAIRDVDPKALVYVGRESSVVLYIRTIKKADMRAALKRVKVDELDDQIIVNGKYKPSKTWIRAWWD